MIVNRYLCPSDGGRGPTMSTWTWAKRRLDWGKDPMLDSMCRWILACWHGMQERTQALESLEMLCQMNFFFRRVVVDRAEGCARPWMRLKTRQQSWRGTHGRGRPVLTSQRRVSPLLLNGTSSHRRVMREVLQEGISGSCCCRRARSS